MKNRALTAYFVILGLLCAAVVAGAKILGQQGAYLADEDGLCREYREWWHLQELGPQ